MSSIPTQCQPIADEIDKLKTEINDLEESLPQLAGPEKWEVLRKIKGLDAELTKKELALTQCLQQGPGYETNVVIIDVCSPTTVITPGEGQMWKLWPAGQVAVETQPIKNSRIQFSRQGVILDSSIGISIQDSPNPTFTGPLFRSGPKSSLPAGAPGNPGGLIEIVVPCLTVVTAIQLTAELPRTPFEVDSDTTIDSIVLGVSASGITITLGITGTVLGPVTVSFNYTLTFTIIPSFNLNDTSEVCLVNPSGPGKISGGGVLSFLIPSEQEIRGKVVSAVQSALNSALQANAARALGWATLPGNVILSMRRVFHRPNDVIFFPAIGAYGGIPLPPPEPAECKQSRSNIASHRLQIGRLYEDRALLDPRNEIDRAEIRRINEEISRLRNELTNLEQKATSLGCR